MLRDTITYAVASILTRSLIVFQIPLFAAYLSPEEFGRLDILGVITILINLSISAEVGQGAGICTAQSDSSDEQKSYGSTALLFSLGCYAVFLVLGTALSPFLSGALIDSALHAPLVKVWVLATSAQGLFLFCHNQLRWLLRPQQFFLVALLYGAVSLGGSWILGVHLGWRLNGIFWGQAGAAVAGALLALWYWLDRFTIRFSLPHLKEMLAFSLPLVPASISLFFIVYVDRFVIKEVLSWGDLGAYGIAYRLASISAVLPVSVNAALPPLVYRHSEDEAFLKRLSFYFSCYCIVIVAVTISFSVISPLLTQSLGAGEYEPLASQITPLLVAGILTSSLYNFSPGLAIKRKSVLIASLSIVTAVVYIPITYILTVSFSLYGAALVPLFSSLTTFGLWYLYGLRYYPIRLPVKTTLILCSLVVGVAFILQSFSMTLSLVVSLVLLGLAATRLVEAERQPTIN